MGGVVCGNIKIGFWERLISISQYANNRDVRNLFGRAYSHRIPLAGLKCLSEKRRVELAGWGESQPARGG